MISIDPFLYLSVLVLISFFGYLFSTNLHKRLIFSFMMIFVVVGILDLKISEVSKLTEGVNILIYIVPLLIILVLIFEQFKKNLRD